MSRPSKVQFHPIGGSPSGQHPATDTLLTKDSDILLTKDCDILVELGDKPCQSNGGVVMRESSTAEGASAADRGLVDSSIPIWSEATTSSPARTEDGKVRYTLCFTHSRVAIQTNFMV